jgi:(S)-ureidoglycine aminohydrolase
MTKATQAAQDVDISEQRLALGRTWHEVWKDDFIWMGPYCPQQFYPTGWGDAAYLLYKDVNRDVDLG